MFRHAGLTEGHKFLSDPLAEKQRRSPPKETADSWQGHTTAMSRRFRSKPHQPDRECLSAPLASGSKGTRSPQQTAKNLICCLPLVFPLFFFSPTPNMKPSLYGKDIHTHMCSTSHMFPSQLSCDLLIALRGRSNRDKHPCLPMPTL